MKQLKIIFMGTPDFAVPVLEALNDHHNVILAVTQPDKPIGRDKEIHSNPIKRFALKHDIEVFQPVNLKDQFKTLLTMKADYIITCAYGQMVPNEILDKYKNRCINIHASLLPKYRGGAPIHRAIMMGEFETGITIMEMVERLDAGDMIVQKTIEITDYDNVGTMHDKLSLLAKQLIIEVLPGLHKMPRTRQDEVGATFAFNIDRKAEHINFDKPKRTVYNHIRGLNPWPIGYAMFGNKEMKIYESYMKENRYYDKVPGEVVEIYTDGIGVNTHDGEIVLTKIQVEGKKIMDVKDYLNGIEDKQSLIGKVFM